MEERGEGRRVATPHAQCFPWRVSAKPSLFAAPQSEPMTRPIAARPSRPASGRPATRSGGGPQRGLWTFLVLPPTSRWRSAVLLLLRAR